MKLKKTASVILLLALSVFFIAQCKNKKEPNNGGGGDNTQKKIKPVPLPSVVPGFKFPEDSNTIYSWLQPNYDSAKVYRHAWGVWAGLTHETEQVYSGDKLLVYQTWLGIAEIQNLAKTGATSDADLESKAGLAPLAVPNQLKHAAALHAAARGTLLKEGTIDTSAGFSFGSTFWVAVAYDPNAARFTLKNGLLKQSVVNSYLKAGTVGNIPAFPANSITTKPVYYVGRKGDSLIRIATWPGEPKTPMAFGPPPASAQDPNVWNTFVYVDVYNKQPAGKQLVPVVGSNPTSAQIAAATCNLNDFIHFKVDSTMATYLNKQQSAVQGDSAHAGDLALLVAMHVTTKEISNWTWQTFYWDHNPSAPMAPSSALAHSVKPKELSNAAAHYSLSTAYLFVTPNQPLTGGTNTSVKPMIGYNPYLEAGFDPSVFQFPNQMNPAYKYGIQTNCMSCHTLASPQALDKHGNTIYSTDQYIDNNDTFFVNKVRLDFAWSLQAAIFNDSASAKK